MVNTLPLEKQRAASPKAEDWVRLLKASSAKYRAEVILSIPEVTRLEVFKALGTEQSNDWVNWCLSSKL